MSEPTWQIEDLDYRNKNNFIDLYATDDEDFDGIDVYPSNSQKSDNDQEN